MLNILDKGIVSNEFIQAFQKFYEYLAPPCDKR